jgi:hypothetical protein
MAERTIARCSLEQQNDSNQEEHERACFNLYI